MKFKIFAALMAVIVLGLMLGPPSWASPTLSPNNGTFSIKMTATTPPAATQVILASVAISAQSEMMVSSVTLTELGTVNAMIIRSVKALGLGTTFLNAGDVRALVVYNVMVMVNSATGQCRSSAIANETVVKFVMTLKCPTPVNFAELSYKIAKTYESGAATTSYHLRA